MVGMVEELKVGRGAVDRFGGQGGSVGGGDLAGGGEQGRRVSQRARKTKSNKQGRDLPSVTVHDERERSEIESVLLGRESLSEPVGDVVGREEGDDHDGELDGDKRERDDEPPTEEHVLEPEEGSLAAWDRSPRVTGRRDSGFYEG